MVSILGQCSGPERTDFEQFLCWDSVVVLKELIFTVSYISEGVAILKEQILNS